MRIALLAFASAVLGCCALSAQIFPAVPESPQQKDAVPSKPTAAAPSQTPPAAAPVGLNQTGNPSIFQKAPPGVEEALRSRLDLFYQCQVDSAFRKAEQYVAEDSKDKYYNSRHQPYFGYKIVQIKFSDDFSKAEVMVVANVDLRFQGRVIRAPMPMNSYWKLENGLWCWYVYIPKPGEIQHTPFGDVVTPDPKDFKTEQPGDQTPIGKQFVNQEDALKRFGKSPTLSKAAVLLTPDGKYEDEIIFGNITKVPFKFHINKDLPPGITVYPMSGQLQPNDGVILKVSYKPVGGGKVVPMFKPCEISYGDENLNMTFYVRVQ
jgi:hypothetical protein